MRDQQLTVLIEVDPLDDRLVVPDLQTAQNLCENGVLPVATPEHTHGYVRSADLAHHSTDRQSV
jgi:hypothetical protein